MPPRKIKDPAEPSSGEGAESLPSPEPEADDSTNDAGVRPIGDPGLRGLVLVTGAKRRVGVMARREARRCMPRWVAPERAE